MKNHFEKLKEDLQARSPNENEFHSAVLEIASDVFKYYEKSSKDEIYHFFRRIIIPNKVHKFKVEWFDDENKLQVNQGYRVQFNNALGPYKGGIRFHKSVNESILKFLGFEQIFKNALTGLQLGGGKGGSDFDPKGKSKYEVARFCKAFMKKLSPYIGENIDIPAGDIGVGTTEIGLMYGEYLELSGKYTGTLTGKHFNFGGSCEREEATGFGCVYLLESALSAHDKSLEGKTVVLSGAGNVSLFAAKKLIEKKAKVLSVSDSKGALFFKEGLTEGELEIIMNKKYRDGIPLSELSIEGSEYKSDQTPWEIEADIYMPCATQNEIDDNDLKSILKNKVTAIVEGANMPLTSKAQDIVSDENIIYLPAKAANAGGVAVSGLEMRQNFSQNYMSKSEVDRKLKAIMENIHNNCSEYTFKKDGVINYKVGANLYSYEKLCETMHQLYLS